jgi:serine/threonine protein kinase
VERSLLGGRYELGPAIGSGGFGTVFRARDSRSGVDVALKLVLPGLGSKVAAERLRREGQIVRRVSSRHVARVYDSGDDDSGTWLVSELVEGAPLSIATLGRALLPHEVLRVARGLLEGLAAVHAAGIVFGDVKPSNILVPYGDKALDSAKLVDFGLARFTTRAELEGGPTEGTVLGTARYMAPELLAGEGDATVRSDLYSVGLVLFELLDVGPLFPVEQGRAQLRARIANDVELAGRVPEPLSDVLARMLARDPRDRWPDAGAAHAAVLDLDTAPVSVIQDEVRTSIAAPMPRFEIEASPASRTSTPPGSRPASSESRRRSVPAAPLARLTSLPPDPVIALRETLRHLDLPMLDALARRERGNPIGRVARAVALALRLELDAAALILEPLAAQNDIARAIGSTVLGPRARRVTRARVDGDREDRWIDAIDAELAAMLVGLATCLGSAEDAPRDANRCARVLARLDTVSAKEGLPLVVDATRTTIRIAHVAARVRRGELDRGVARDLVSPLAPASQREPPSSPVRDAPFHVVVRALCTATLSAEDPAAHRELERAERTAAETGATLLDAAAATAFGALLVHESPRNERGLLVLERASTLLANGDAPSLEHEAEQHRAIALLALGRWGDALLPLRAARIAAHAERAGEQELLSASLGTLAELAAGDLQTAYESAALLGESRLARAEGRTAALGWVARALASLSASDHEGAEDALTEAEARVREVDRRNADVYVLVEVIGILFDSARGALPDVSGPASGLERFAEEHGFEAFYWLDLLAAVIARLADTDVSSKMGAALARLDPVLGPKSRLAREHRTDIPPSAAL